MISLVADDLEFEILIEDDIVSCPSSVGKKNRGPEKNPAPGIDGSTNLDHLGPLQGQD